MWKFRTVLINNKLIILFRDKRSKCEYTLNGTCVTKLSICHENLNYSALIDKYLPTDCARPKMLKKICELKISMQYDLHI